MAKTNIAWATDVWNVVTGCTRVSSGCDHCYAFALHDQRYKANHKKAKGMGLTTELVRDICLPWQGEGPDPWALPFPRQYDKPFSHVQLLPDRLGDPLRWRKPRRVFVNSMGDLFHEDVPDEFIDRVFAVMAICGADRQRCRGARCKHEEESKGCWQQGDGRVEPVHQFLVLTKRPERMRDYLVERSKWTQPIHDRLNDPAWGVGYDEPAEMVNAIGWPLPNVWLGVSVENQETADERIPLLLNTPAAVRWISAEPLLVPVDLRAYLGSPVTLHGPAPRLEAVQHPLPEPYVGWVVVGGESGPRARRMEHAWAQQIRDQCREAGVPMFFKQASGRRPGMPIGDPALDECKEYPR